MIHTGADWHVGDMFCREKEIDQMLREVQTHDNHYLILDGDLANNATKSSVSTVRREVNTTATVRKDRAEARTGQRQDSIVGSGNHEYRTYKEAA